MKKIMLVFGTRPEEMNRQVTCHIATYNFAPIPLSKKVLIEEQTMGDIYVTGNTVIDTLHCGE